MVEPLAFGKKYRIRVTQTDLEAANGQLEYTSDWFTLTEDEPVKELTCVLKPGE